ncbi:DUF1569 domain-containing protein [Algoriphagus machipongonensis]|uniref:DUF1569 domain-containing protein n=1 Tax=Algoriphagus machipongonensis TaxID=388413 RepID=A3HX65_9BACT|nr:DUF1569 domain-containing protein [Algoriphagus machipongonensis]EAZ81188.1 hypothetical protein ALPR1_19168 [Algoriphagus machipongonensis]
MDLKHIKERLSQLKEDSKKNFGIMTPQHMVEHLTITMKISSNRIPYPDFTPSEKQLQQKKALLHTDLQFPQGVMAPGIGERLMPFKHSDLETAKEKLLSSIEEYENFFKENPSNHTNHPRFGLMTYQEWELFHPKHIEHHFGQFNI